MRYDLRPRSTTELMDGAFQLYREHFGVFFVTALVLSPPTVLMTWWVQSVAARAQDPSAVPGPLLALLALPPLLLAASLSYLLQQAVLTAAISDAYLGRPVTMGESFRLGLRRLGPVLAASFLYMLGVSLGTLLCLIPGMIAAVLWMFYVPALVVEDASVVESLKRSTKLTRGRRWQLAGVLFVFSLVTGLLNAAASAVIPAAVAAIPVLGAFLKNLPSVLLAPLYPALVALAYFDARIRDEGFDLEVLAQSLPSPAGASPNPSP